jgi:hypothetical protein
MLALEQGSIWLMSTPWATTGFFGGTRAQRFAGPAQWPGVPLLLMPPRRPVRFYEAWADGGEAWERVSVKATECARFSQEWLEGERKDWSAEEFQREYMGEFLQDERSAFDAEVVDDAMDDGVPPLEFGIPEFRKERLRWR